MSFLERYVNFLYCMCDDLLKDGSPLMTSITKYVEINCLKITGTGFPLHLHLTWKVYQIGIRSITPNFIGWKV